MRALIYLRRSAESEARTVSLEVQRETCRQYGAGLPADVVAELVDDGVSGGAKRKPWDAGKRFSRILAAVDAHQAQILIVYHLDRLARDNSGLGELARALANRQCALHSATQGKIDSQHSDGFLMFSIHGTLAQHYRMLCSEKTKAALARLKSQRKRWAGSAPYGTRWDGMREVVDSEGHRHLVGGVLAVVPEELAAITHARELRQSGLSLRKTARALAEAGFLDRTGSPYHPEQVRRLLATQQDNGG